MRFANTELYFNNPSEIKSEFTPSNEEAKHIIQVMRHKVGDKLNFTDGCGNLFETEIIQVSGKNKLSVKVLNKVECENHLNHITIFLPLLKSTDKLEFALEKCIELGFTNFVVFNSDNSHKRNVRLERLNKLALAAMKQSIQTHLPKINFIKNISEYNFDDSYNIIFDQLADFSLNHHLKDFEDNKNINLIFGPEAGLSDREMYEIYNKYLASLNVNRLRSETAIISAASIISNHYLIKKNIL